MASAAPETRTTIDSLVELLKKKGKMDLNSISIVLGVDNNVVENWAKVLEKGNIVKISYEVGKMFVSLVTLTPEQEAGVKTQIDARAASLEAQSGSELLSLDKLSQTIGTIKTSVSAAERAEEEQLPEVKKGIAELNRMYEAIEQRTKGIEQMAKQAEELYDSVNKRANDLTNMINTLDSNVSNKGLDSIKESSAKVSGEVANVRSQITAVDKATNDSLDQLRKSVQAQTATILTQIEKSRKDLQAQTAEYQRQMSEVEKDLRSKLATMSSAMKEMNAFVKDKEATQKKLRDIKAEFNNRYLKMSEEMRASRAAADTASQELTARVSKMKASFGEAAEIDNTIMTIKGQTADLEAEIAQAKQDLGDIIAQSRALRSLAGVSTEQKAGVLENITQKARAASSRVSRIKQKAGAAEAETKKLQKGN